MSDKIIKILKELDINTEIISFSQSTKTAKEAANALNCEIAQIVKSLIFVGKNSKKPVLILTSGINRVDEEKVSKIIGEFIEKADADFVKEKTGFSIGGVCPIGHKNKIDIYIDKDLMNFEFVWAAAGTSNSVFKISSKTLLQITNAKIIEIK
ncbi:MAG: YbaK/EbsC family protein [Exilispira sp.]